MQAGREAGFANIGLASNATMAWIADPVAEATDLGALLPDIRRVAT